MSSNTGFITSPKEYPFLDPLEACSIKVGTLLFHSVESLFLASGFADPEVRERFTKCQDGWDARSLHDDLMSANAKRRPDWAAKVKASQDLNGSHTVPVYVELLRRAWFLRFVQDPDALEEFIATEYRPIHLDLKLPSKNGEAWISDSYNNEVLTTVRAQLRELTPSQLVMIKAGNPEGAVQGVGGPAVENVPANGVDIFPYRD